MPELPEVETTRLGLLPHTEGKRIAMVTVRERRLRWPVTPGLAQKLRGSTIKTISRRGKYLLWACENHGKCGFLLNHLGMSGILRVVPANEPVLRHDHVDIGLADGTLIRYTDPRRFGAMLWIAGTEPHHPLLDSLGPEPLSTQFTAAYLHKAAMGRTVSVKEFIMNSHVVVGVGNIYASEALFRAGIHPRRAVGRISPARHQRLVESIRKTLGDALNAGGSSLRDYLKADGEAGYFQVDAFVYGRAGLPCRVCETPIRSFVQGQRSTFFCPACQH